MNSSQSEQRVRVAVNIQPLKVGCANCITVGEGETSKPQVKVNDKVYTVDYVFGSEKLASTSIYDECVAPLVDSFFNGISATIFAYGQCGSGKAYTMGFEKGSKGGIIPRVVEDIFNRVDLTKFTVKVSFVEISNNLIKDLLSPSKVVVRVREMKKGKIVVDQASEVVVETKENMANYLSKGSSSRVAGSTNKNCRSSLSHAIFTITMKQKTIAHCKTDDVGDDIVLAKLRFVDLADSERTDSKLSEEGISISMDFLTLGIVIKDLRDERKQKSRSFNSYRGRTLTHFLKDSLGGNSKTQIIGCISCADKNAHETSKTLEWISSDCNIQNKENVNSDSMRSMQKLKEELKAARVKIAEQEAIIEALKAKVSELEASHDAQPLQPYVSPSPSGFAGGMSSNTPLPHPAPPGAHLSSAGKDVSPSPGGIVGGMSSNTPLPHPAPPGAQPSSADNQSADSERSTKCTHTSQSNEGHPSTVPKGPNVKRRKRRRFMYNEDEDPSSSGEEYGSSCTCSHGSGCKRKRCECHVVNRNCGTFCKCGSTCTRRLFRFGTLWK